MALENLAINTGDLFIGIIMLIIGIAIYAASGRLPSGASIFGVIAGIVLGLIGIVIIVMAFI